MGDRVKKSNQKHSGDVTGVGKKETRERKGKLKRDDWEFDWWNISIIISTDGGTTGGIYNFLLQKSGDEVHSYTLLQFGYLLLCPRIVFVDVFVTRLLILLSALFRYFCFRIFKINMERELLF